MSTSASKTLPVLVLLALLSGATAMGQDCTICGDDDKVAGVNCYEGKPTTEDDWGKLITDRMGMGPEEKCKEEDGEYRQEYTCEQARKSANGNCAHYEERCCGDHNNNDMDQDMDKKCAPCDEDVAGNEDDNTIAGVNCYATEDDRTTAHTGGVANVNGRGGVDYDCKNEGVPDPYTCTGMFDWMQSQTTPVDKDACDHYHSQCCGRRFCGAGTEWKQAADESRSRSCVATYEGAMAACKKQRDGTATGGADWSFTCGHVGDTCKKEGPNEPMARRLETLG